MFRSIFTVIIILFASIAAIGIHNAAADDYADILEITEADITIDHHELPFTAYLCMSLKNIGGKTITNTTLEISYFDKDDRLMHKAVIKKVLNHPIPPGETREYKVRLSGDFFDKKNEKYPYSTNVKVNDFDIRIVSVNFG